MLQIFWVSDNKFIINIKRKLLCFFFWMKRKNILHFSCLEVLADDFFFYWFIHFLTDFFFLFLKVNFTTSAILYTTHTHKHTHTTPFYLSVPPNDEKSFLKEIFKLCARNSFISMGKVSFFFATFLTLSWFLFLVHTFSN